MTEQLTGSQSQKPPFRKFANAFRALIESADSSVHTIAVRSGLEKSDIQEWVNGESKPASLQQLGRAVGTLELRMNEAQTKALSAVLESFDTSLSWKIKDSTDLFMKHEGNIAFVDGWLSQQPKERRLGLYLQAARECRHLPLKDIVSRSGWKKEDILALEDGTYKPKSVHELLPLLKQYDDASARGIAFSAPYAAHLFNEIMNTKETKKYADALSALNPDWLARQPAAKQFGLYLRACRMAQNNMPLEDAAGLLNCAPEQLKAWEQGNDIPSRLIRHRLMQFCSYSPHPAKHAFDTEYYDRLMNISFLAIANKGADSAAQESNERIPRVEMPVPENTEEQRQMLFGLRAWKHKNNDLQFGSYVSACRRVRGLMLGDGAKEIGCSAISLIHIENAVTVPEKDDQKIAGLKEFCKKSDPNYTVEEFERLRALSWEAKCQQKVLEAQKSPTKKKKKPPKKLPVDHVEVSKVKTAEVPAATAADVFADVLPTQAPHGVPSEAQDPKAPDDAVPPRKRGHPSWEKMAIADFRKRSWSPRDSYKRFGLYVRACRLKEGLTHEQLVEKIDGSLPFLRRIENLEVIPHARQIESIAAFCSAADPDFKRDDFDGMLADLRSKLEEQRGDKSIKMSMTDTTPASVVNQPDVTRSNTPERGIG